MTMEHVSFHYPRRDQPTIKEASIEIHTGQRVAVVGPSGCGKSTLARLLTGLIRPSSGKILVGGLDPHRCGPNDMLPSIGYMTQEPYIFAGSIADNVRFARPDATDEAVEKALQLAGLTSVKGGSLLAERVGPSGAGLSGGQRQRVMLARVLLIDPQFIIFDEPSAALDFRAARRFFSDVLAALTGKTILVITHDTQNLDWADATIEIGDGSLQMTCTRRTA